MSNQVRNIQASRFVLVPGHNPGRWSRGDRVVLWSYSVVEVWWKYRSRIRVYGRWCRAFRTL